MHVLDQLTQVLKSRKEGDPQQSYVASLYAEGVDKMLVKIAEETTELVMAVKEDDREKIIHETADLWFHTLVMLVHAGLSADDILKELTRRFGESGHVEKARRNK